MKLTKTQLSLLRDIIWDRERSRMCRIVSTDKPVRKLISLGLVEVLDGSDDYKLIVVPTPAGLEESNKHPQVKAMEAWLRQDHDT
jgi:hypothetical protein